MNICIPLLPATKAFSTKCYSTKWLVAAALLCMSMNVGFAQDTATIYVQDTNYYKTYDNFLTSRIYSNKKYTTVELVSPEGKKIPYRPNTPVTLGIGATYQWFTLNLAYGFKFMNQNKDSRGETKYLDLQSHIYGRKSVLDLYGQFYKGFYLKPDGNRPVDDYYIRPDIGITQLGFHYEYMFNWRKFSYRAAMLQSERQLKSAGTPMLGLESHYTITSADSSMVPKTSMYNGLPGVTRLRSFEIGPSIGYAYTLVLLHRFFVTGALTGLLNINFAKGTYEDGSKNKVSVRPDVMVRFAAGFNRPRWSTALTWVNQNLNTQGAYYDYNFLSGSARISFAYRFIAGPKLKKALHPLDVINDRIIQKILAAAKPKPQSN